MKPQPSANVVLQEPIKPRNPLAVLGVYPIGISAIRSVIHSKVTLLSEMGGNLREQQSPKEYPGACRFDPDAEVSHPTLVALDAQIARKSIDAEPGDRKLELMKAYRGYLNMFVVLHAADANIEAYRRQEVTTMDAYRLLLGDSATDVPPMPQEELVEEDGTRFTKIPSLTDMEAVLRVLQRNLFEAKPKTATKKRQVQQALKRMEKFFTAQTVLNVTRHSLAYYIQELDIVLRSHDLLLGQEAVIKAAYDALAREYHPDRTGNTRLEGRYQEATTAYDQLQPAAWDGELEAKLAVELVLGQDPDLLSSDKREVAHILARLFSGVFVQEIPPPPDSVPCTPCEARGNISSQGPNDFFAVPVPCEACNGAGYIAKAAADIRQALRNVTQKKRRP